MQEEVVERVLAGQHTLAVMPTGAGKSLCYQLPAVAREGTALVISPLIALMHDQIRSADAIGLRAASLTSADADREQTIQRFKAGELDLLYVAPERATGEAFRRLIGRVNLSLIAIDEAHCVSEWGHDFRPDYRQLRSLLDDNADVPRLALTATADARTRADILAQLGIPEDGLVIAGFDRPNIRYHVRPRDGLNAQLKALLAGQPGPGIVYATSRDKTETDRRAACRDRPAGGCLSRRSRSSVRARNQAAFVESEEMVIAATIAFGMGIDKPDVRFVAHAGIPKSIEAYYQETGRAGRDGDPAEAWLFWGAEDFARARTRIEQEVEPDRRAGERERLNALAAFVETQAAAAPSCSAISARTRPRPAAIATIASTRRRRSTRPRSPANCCRPRSGPRCASAWGTSRTFSPATTMRRSAVSATTNCRCSGLRMPRSCTWCVRSRAP